MRCESAGGWPVGAGGVLEVEVVGFVVLVDSTVVEISILACFGIVHAMNDGIGI